MATTVAPAPAFLAVSIIITPVRAAFVAAVTVAVAVVAVTVVVVLRGTRTRASADRAAAAAAAAAAGLLFLLVFLPSLFLLLSPLAVVVVTGFVLASWW